MILLCYWMDGLVRYAYEGRDKLR